MSVNGSCTGRHFYRTALELFDNPIASALRFERRDDIVFYHETNVSVGDVAVDLGDALVLGGGKCLAVAIGVSEQAALAHVDLPGVELV